MRDVVVDNAKVILVVLVVFGHFLEPKLSDSAAVSYAYRVNYTFHIPAFVFLAGMTSSADHSRSNIYGLCKLLIIFQLLYVSFSGEFSLQALSTPYWLPWFLLSLVFWRMSLPIWHKIPAPVLMAFFIALAAGFAPIIGYPLSLSRTLVFLPFFLAGHFYGPGIVRWLADRHAAYLWFASIASAVLILYFAYFIVDPRWLYGSFPYRAFGVENLTGAALRSLQLLAAAAGVFLVLVISNCGRTFFSERGERVLSAYLVHGFLVLLSEPLLEFLAKAHMATAMFMSVALTLLSVWLLTSKPVFKCVAAIYKTKRGA